MVRIKPAAEPANGPSRPPFPAPAGGAAKAPPSDQPDGYGLVRAAGRPADEVLFDQQVVAFFVDAAELLGAPKSVAAIYGICFASATPLSFADVSSRLDISQGSISQGLRVLRDIGALKVMGSRDRREYFAPDMELRKLASRFVKERLEKQLVATRGRLQSLQAAIPAQQKGSARELQARLKCLQGWHEKARALVPIVKTFLTLA